jgi:dTDP-4-dehydrorhamnose 3,5-epimerase
METIEGVKITELRQIEDERGKVMHMLRNDSDVYQNFGEIYFSCTYFNAIKAWHMHKHMTLNYAVVKGKLKIVLYDERRGSKTFGLIQEIYLSTETYKLLTVPPMIWNGFKGLDERMTIVANCSTEPYTPDEIVRKNPFTSDIPYVWE